MAHLGRPGHFSAIHQPWRQPRKAKVRGCSAKCYSVLPLFLVNFEDLCAPVCVALEWQPLTICDKRAWEDSSNKTWEALLHTVCMTIVSKHCRGIWRHLITYIYISHVVSNVSTCLCNRIKSINSSALSHHMFVQNHHFRIMGYSNGWRPWAAFVKHERWVDVSSPKWLPFPCTIEICWNLLKNLLKNLLNIVWYCLNMFEHSRPQRDNYAGNRVSVQAMLLSERLWMPQPEVIRVAVIPKLQTKCALIIHMPPGSVP